VPTNSRLKRDVGIPTKYTFKENEAAAIVKQALYAIGARRGSLIGRPVSLFKGGARHDREAEAIAERYERERMSKHRNLEALKERQFAATQQARLRQAQEGKAIFELHLI
jgi:hypothetical protein